MYEVEVSKWEMKIPRKASSHGQRKWSGSSSISKVNVNVPKQILLFMEEVKWNMEAGIASLRESHAQSRRAKQRGLAGAPVRSGEEE